MSSNEIRQKFLNFFKATKHTIVSSSSLIPDDPSVLFTTAGMQQFKLYYIGQADAMKDFGSKNTASVQKCIRTSDIDEVGDESHLTFFEMLGNFSFGGYFKKEAIKYAYDFIAKEMSLKIDYVSIFGGGDGLEADTESEKIWKSIDKNIKIKKFGKTDNFWGPTGSEGPCGPTTEIYVKTKAGKSIEIWNIVFNEYYCDKNKNLKALDIKGVDTGMGLERLAMVLQDKITVFDTDLFEPIIKEIDLNLKSQNSKSQSKIQNLDKIKRIIADHLKASVFIISEGIMPSNVERGYILRRLLRRIIRYGKLLNLNSKFYISIVKIIGDIYRDVYPEIKNRETEILTVIQNEEEKFLKTLEKGLREFNRLTSANIKVLSKENIFHLYDTFGFPLELTKELTKEKGIKIDEKGFYEEFKKHQEKSRAGLEKKFGGHGLILDTGELKAANKEELKKVIKLHTATHMLQAALRKIFGKSIKQMGSDITPERLRFDFNFDRKLSLEEIKKIEDLVNKKIDEGLTVEKKEIPYQEAIEQGALAFFKGKYPEIVSVYKIYNPKTGEVFSKEVCGGPHVQNTRELKSFKILKEEGVAAGVRRIRAIVM